MADQNTNTTNTGDAGTTTPQAEDKTFTQDQVNAIIGERLQKERQKAESDIAKREQELSQREFLLNAKSTLTEKGLPAELADYIIADPEALEKAVNLLTEHIKSNKARIAEVARGLRGAGMTGKPSQPLFSAPDPIREAMGLNK